MRTVRFCMLSVWCQVNKDRIRIYSTVNEQ